MSDLAAFADGLVHDIRNPLNVIRTNVYLLRQRIAADDVRLNRAVDRIDDQVTVALRILEGVQAFYRCDRPALQQVNLAELVAHVIATSPFPEEYVLLPEVPADLPLLDADPQLLDAALRALLRNAVEGSPTGGTIHIRATPGEGRVLLEVADTGEGMPADVAGRAFEPFFSTRRAHSGLGLALVDKVARTHGGQASLRSSPEGTVVGVQLPVA